MEKAVAERYSELQRKAATLDNAEALELGILMRLMAQAEIASPMATHGNEEGGSGKECEEVASAKECSENEGSDNEDDAVSPSICGDNMYAILGEEFHEHDEESGEEDAAKNTTETPRRTDKKEARSLMKQGGHSRVTSVPFGRPYAMETSVHHLPSLNQRLAVEDSANVKSTTRDTALSALKALKPPIYKGKYEKLQAWIFSFQLWCKTHDVTDEVKMVQVASLRLQDNAMEWLMTKCEDGNTLEPFATFANFCEGLEQVSTVHSL